LALGGFAAIWRRPTLAAPVGAALALGALLIASALLGIYRTGDTRFDPYNVDRYLRPMLDRLAEVPCHRDSPGEVARCEAVMVAPDPLLTDYFLAYLRAPLPWYAIDALPAPEDTLLLDQLVRRYPTIYLARDRSAQADDDQGRRAVERYLAAHAFKLDEERFEDWARLVRFSAAGTLAEQSDVPRALGEMTLVQSTLRIQRDQTILAARDAGPPRAGEPTGDGMVQAEASDMLQIGLRWRADAPPEANYTTFVQLIDSASQVVAQRDRPPGDGLFPTAPLQPGETIADNLALPLDLPPGRYRLIAGLYRTDIEGFPRLAGPGGDFVELAEVVVGE
ncbi:MAG: hypothetical protein H0V67_07160, partial [Geodermatophilaceae bacterium]|nr:hypothetical protein [Geodermatophilaceae bacterium]